LAIISPIFTSHAAQAIDSGRYRKQQMPGHPNTVQLQLTQNSFAPNRLNIAVLERFNFFGSKRKIGFNKKEGTRWI
jgi:hypothetical protein